MSLGITPYDFVQKVFYVQEKVRLDFVPTDDVYKEVLMEANLVLEELQGVEDWSWLRGTTPIGVSKHTHGDVLEYDLPASAYKPSRMYGDCVRLHSYRFEKYLHLAFIDWNHHVKYHKLKPYTAISCRTKNFTSGSHVSMDLSDAIYGGTLTGHVDDLYLADLDIIEAGKWYLDPDTNLYYGEPDENGCCGVIWLFRLKDQQELPEPIPDRYHHHHRQHAIYLPDNPLEGIVISDTDFIQVPYASIGNMYRRDVRQVNSILVPQVRSGELKAIQVGDRITFNRPFTPFESDRIVMLDVQKRIEQFHICDDNCYGEIKSKVNRDADGHITGMSTEKTKASYPDNPCYRTLKKMLTEIPDPNYVVIKTASLHAEGSPAAQGRLAGLQDQASRMLSAMRSNDSEHTNPDMVDYMPIDFVNVL